LNVFKTGENTVLDLEGDFHAVLCAFFDDEWLVLEGLEIFLAMELDLDVWSTFNLFL
jgi:hypothetical protein